jgi:hypothetical protein
LNAATHGGADSDDLSGTRHHLGMHAAQPGCRRKQVRRRCGEVLLPQSPLHGLGRGTSAAEFMADITT